MLEAIMLARAEQARVHLDAQFDKWAKENPKAEPKNNPCVGRAIRLDDKGDITYSTHRMIDNCVLVCTDKSMSKTDSPVFKMPVGVACDVGFRWLHKVGSWRGGSFHESGERASKVRDGNIFATNGGNIFEQGAPAMAAAASAPDALKLDIAMLTESQCERALRSGKLTDAQKLECVARLFGK